MPNSLSSATDAITQNTSPTNLQPSASLRASLSGPDTIAANGASIAAPPSTAYDGSLSGPDTIPANPTALPAFPQSGAYSGSLSGPDDYGSVMAANTGITSRTSSSMGSLSGAGSIYEYGSMGTLTLYPFNPLSPYYFPYQGHMSEEVMHLYLDRAIEMTNLSMADDDGNPGPVTAPYIAGVQAAYNAQPGQQTLLYDIDYEHGSDLARLRELRPKMVTFMAGFWNTLCDPYVAWVSQTLTWDCEYIHGFDTEIICHAALAEILFSANEPGLGYAGNRLTVPTDRFPDIISMFYGSTPRVVTPGCDENAPNLETTYFDFVLMRYQYRPDVWGATGFPPNVNYTATTANPNLSFFPDITQPETRMYYYYIATLFIDAGCEAIHMGDIQAYLRVDAKIYGNAHYWSLIEQIRAYARVNARRGMVLLEAQTYGLLPGTPAENVVNDVYLGNSFNWNSQLLHDFHALGIYFTRYATCYYSGDFVTTVPDPDDLSATCNVYAMGTGNLPCTMESFMGLVNQSWPGYNIQGWYASHNPYLLRFDNGGSLCKSGCDANPVSPYQGDTWGYDDTTWFAAQTEALRKLILPYCYYRLKCLDPYGHLNMPGRVVIYPLKNIALPNIDIHGDYSPIQDAGMLSTMLQIWNNALAGPDDWAFHNFTMENVSDNNGVYDVSSSLIFVGDDKIYYISTDGYIHGYIKVNGDYNDGTWLTVSPSYASGILVKAQSDLVASPDGTMLLYIGTDGYFHGFNIIDVWTYSFFSWAGDPAILPVTGVIFPDNDRIYYVGVNRYNGTYQVHGFQNSGSGFMTVSPTYSAGDVSGQLQPSGPLTYVKGSPYDTIYYTTTGGLLACFDVHDLIDYAYYPFAGNYLLSDNNIQILGNLAVYGSGMALLIYFVGLRTGDGGPRVFVLNNGSAGWGINSLSNNADVPQASQQPSNSEGVIAISPAGHTIAYIGTDSNIHFFYTGTWPYGYQDTNFFDPLLGIQFTSEIDIYYIAKNEIDAINTVCHLKYQEAYCENNALYEYPT